MRNPFKLYKEFKEKIRQESIEKSLNEIRGNFYLNERNGSIYIVCEGKAVYKADEKETTSQLIEKLEQIRKVSVEYKNQKKNE